MRCFTSVSNRISKSNMKLYTCAKWNSRVLFKYREEGPAVGVPGTANHNSLPRGAEPIQTLQKAPPAPALLPMHTSSIPGAKLGTHELKISRNLTAASRELHTGTPSSEMPFRTNMDCPDQRHPGAAGQGPCSLLQDLPRVPLAGPRHSQSFKSFK